MSANDRQTALDSHVCIRGVASRVHIPILDSSGLLVTGGLSTLASTISLDGATAATGPTPVELATQKSVVSVDLTATQTDNSSVDLWVTSTEGVDMWWPITTRAYAEVTTGTFDSDQTGLNSDQVRLTGKDTRDDIYQGLLLKVTSGSGSGHGRFISAWDGSAQEMTLLSAPEAAVTGSDTYSILAPYSVRIADQDIADKSVHGVILDKTDIAVVNSQTSYDLGAGSTADDLYNDHIALFFDAAGVFAGHGVVSDYDADGGAASAPLLTLESATYLKKTITAAFTLMIVRNNFLSQTLLETVSKNALKAVIPVVERQYKGTVTSATSDAQFVASLVDIDNVAVDAANLGNLNGRHIVMESVQGGSGSFIDDGGRILTTSNTGSNMSFTLDPNDKLQGLPAVGDIFWISAF